MSASASRYSKGGNMGKVNISQFHFGYGVSTLYQLKSGWNKYIYCKPYNPDLPNRSTFFLSSPWWNEDTGEKDLMGAASESDGLWGVGVSDMVLTPSSRSG